MKGFFLKLFNIYPGEAKSALLFSLLGFLWAFGVTSGQKFADALFLLHVGPGGLPTAYQLTALILITLAAILLYAFHVTTIKKIFISALAVGVIFYFVIHLLLLYDIGIESKWLWYALRVFGATFFAIIATCFWTFVDHYHHLQDSKRLYGLFSSMIFMGIVCTGAVMRSGSLSFLWLTLVILALLIAAITLISYISNHLHLVHDENESMGTPGQSSSSLRQQLRSILSSRFTLLLMSGSILIFILLVITEYNYMSAFTLLLDPEGTIRTTGEEQNAQLTQFLGKWIALVNIANIFIGVFLYSRFIRRFGSTSLVVCTPLILLVTFLGWPFSDSLLFPLMGLFVVEGTLYVMDDSNFNLLLNAVPIKLKYKIRLMIESFFEPIGMLISSLLLSLTWIDSKLLGLFLSFCLVVVALGLQKEYLQGIYRNLAENALHFHRRAFDWFLRMGDKERKGSKKRLLAMLRQGEPAVVASAIEALLSFNDDTAIPKILHEVDHMDDDAKIIFTTTLLQKKYPLNSLIIDHMEKWLEKPCSLRLKGEIHFYLAVQGWLSGENIMADIDNPDLLLRGASLVALRKSQGNLAFSRETTEITEYTEKQRENGERQVNHLLNSETVEEISMGLKIIAQVFYPQDVEKIMALISHPSFKVRHAAAVAMGEAASPSDKKYVPALIRLLASSSSDSECRLHYLAALEKIGDVHHVADIIVSSHHFKPQERRQAEKAIVNMGPKSIPVLLSLAKDVTLHDRGRVLASRVLGLLDLPLLRHHVYEIMSIEIDRAYFYYYYYHHLQSAYPSLDLRLMSDALLTGYHSVMDFMIQLLGIAGEVEDAELLSRSLRSPHPKVRSQVVEALEKTCEAKIFRLLLPLISDWPQAEKVHAYERMHPILSLEQILERLESSAAYVDQIVATTLKYQLNMPNWRDSLTKHLSSKEEIFQHFAKELLEA